MYKHISYLYVYIMYGLKIWDNRYTTYKFPNFVFQNYSFIFIYFFNNKTILRICNYELVLGTISKFDNNEKHKTKINIV